MYARALLRWLLSVGLRAVGDHALLEALLLLQYEKMPKTLQRGVVEAGRADGYRLL